MDVNQTRFQLVYGKADWLPAPPAAASPPQEPLFDWNDEDATLTLHKELFVFPRPRGQNPLNVESRRGSGRDRYGNWYWISEDCREVRFLGAAEKSSEHFWSAADALRGSSADPSGGFSAVTGRQAADCVMSGLTVTTDHYLVVGLLEPAGLLIFDLHSGGAPLQFFWPDQVVFSPFDLAAAPDGGALILDRSNKTLWMLDRHFRLHTQTNAGSSPQSGRFEPVAGKLQQDWVQCCARRITSNLGKALSTVSDPVAIEALPDGSAIILDNPETAFFSVLHHYCFGRESRSPLALDEALAPYVSPASAPESPHPQSLRGYDIAFVADQASGGGTLSGTLYVAGIDGEQVFAFSVNSPPAEDWLEPAPRYLPMRRFGGKALVAGGGSVYYDYQDRWWPLAEQPRARYQVEASLQLPLLPSNGDSPGVEAAFDGKQPACTWHRVFLDACIPPGAGVAVESRANDEKDLLPSTPWQGEPGPYLRDDGPEIPYYQSPLNGPVDRAGTWESLLQNARGRYLQLRLTLSGTGRNTPRLNALRVYYPRFSYLRQYLPAVYRDDPVSTFFLERYLANVEGFYTALEGKIVQLQALFDCRTTPAQYLDWLAGWVGIALDLGWSDRTRRLVLSHAPQMFRERGTRAGMIRSVRLGLDPCPDESLFAAPSCGSYDCTGQKVQTPFTVRVVERFLTRNAPGVVYGDPTDVLGPGSTTSSLPWTPAQGAEPLHDRFRSYLKSLYGSVSSLNASWDTNYSGFDDPNLVLAPTRPSQKWQAADWQRFLRGSLGFTYAPVTDSDEGAYQQFLAGQYANIGDLNAAYKLSDPLSSFAAASLPEAIPAGGIPLRDWIVFVSTFLPRRYNANRFTVLVPVTPDDSPDTQLSKLGVAQRIAELEKPAHTAFDVRLYWGMFRVGEARVGLDTLLGQSSRSVAIVLGRSYLAEGHLAFAEPWNVSDRTVIGGNPAAKPCCGHRPQERCT